MIGGVNVANLKEIRKLGIDYCKKNLCGYTYISANNVDGFYISVTGDDHTVFMLNSNGSLHPIMGTSFAVDFHKHFKKRTERSRDGKKTLAELANFCEEDLEDVF